MSPRPPARTDAGGTTGGFLLAVLLLVVLAAAAFFYFGGSADVDTDINPPAVDVSSSPAPSAEAK